MGAKLSVYTPLFLWYVMNDLMHEIQLWFLGTLNDYFGHLPRLNYWYKIEYLHPLRVFASTHAKISVYFNIRTYFSILHTHF